MTVIDSESDWNCTEIPEPGKQVAQQVKLKNGTAIRYFVYLPEDFCTENRYPLMLFLHGRGERGDSVQELKRVLVHGPPKLIEQGLHFPCIVISPQQATDNLWWTTDNLLDFLSIIEKRYHADLERITCTGLSMGGFASWALAAELPDYFAAIAPVCGGGEIEWAEKLIQTPVWAFHGVQDDIIPIKRSEEMIEAIQKLNGDAKLTTYPDLGHDSWTETYNNPDLYQWLFSHKKK